MNLDEKLVGRANRYIQRSLENGVDVAEIRRHLLEMGLPPEFVDPATRSVEEDRRAASKAGAIRLVWLGLGLAVLGGGITAATYSAASQGGRYVVAWGLIVVGIWNMLNGLAKLSRL